MVILTVAVVILGVFVVANLAVTFAALRRLREYGEQLAELPDGAPVAAELLGRSLPDLAVDTINGGKVAAEALRDRPWLIGFFSATCRPCRTSAPMFAAAHEADRLAVVVTDGATDEERDEMLGLLDGTPHVVTGSGMDGLAGGLGVQMFPTVVRTDQTGTVVMADNSARSLQHRT
ncbi:hypothetical protein Nm8I071_23490 [Nonomuraea sp. TT08I-71]|nr:hypothetical protein Nm8I071_23490 [Nonomuraea sp. TT08I-71]